MHLTIYFNNKPLILCTEITEEISLYLQRDESLFKDQFDPDTVKTVLHEIHLPAIKSAVILHNNPDEILNAVKTQFTFIQAAGGLVHTNENDCLLIFRKGKWDLPKGKLDEGESLEACSIREVQEETGITTIELEKPLCVTYHTYSQAGEPYLKESHWYLMKTGLKEVLTPQAEEDIEKCEWVAIDNLAPYLENMHASVIDVLKAGIKVLGETKNI